ncbi:hypothetical protein AK812_SmicGene10331 [Symbiodinium microadriaticum]|uniref:Uncharacterized protein n=1 Tax=Symbiodinium microadriaticum TaxID=2951 RepID=A0A1Q9EG33_SYMMI|nr:hypothetical protein AK812_SmicGene10331 [Symbiodinium microadriaticum]
MINEALLQKALSHEKHQKSEDYTFKSVRDACPSLLMQDIADTIQYFDDAPLGKWARWATRESARGGTANAPPGRPCDVIDDQDALPWLSSGWPLGAEWAEGASEAQESRPKEIEKTMESLKAHGDEKEERKNTVLTALYNRDMPRLKAELQSLRVSQLVTKLDT